MVLFSWHVNPSKVILSLEPRESSALLVYIYIFCLTSSDFFEHSWMISRLVWFYGISTIVGYLKLNSVYTYILNIFGLVLWHINHCRLFKVKSGLYIYIKYIWFGLVLWHINHCRLFKAKFSLYIRYIWFGLVLWHINHCRLFKAKSGLYIYIKYIWFGLVLWHINHCRLFKAKFSLYIKYIWFGLWHINHCGLFNAKSSLYIYIKYI